jgi:uncharacterized protein (TIGR02646 family)
MGAAGVKKIRKTEEPESLTRFRSSHGSASWEQLRDDRTIADQRIYSDVRQKVLEDQGNLCAYCEIKLNESDHLTCRVEHFHPKSDQSQGCNWALDWRNLLAACNGGSNPNVAQPGFHLRPTDENLSCDAHKDCMIQKGKLPVACEGLIFDPLGINAYPNLFKVDYATGKLAPDVASCGGHAMIEPNSHASNAELAQCTIDMLNLNCDRLCRERLKLIWSIEQGKKKQKEMGFRPEQGLANLARMHFRARWPKFFTTIRFCLGQVAEAYLHSINYQG